MMGCMTIRHGTTTGYSHHKCRCDLCRAAVNQYNRERQAAIRAKTPRASKRRPPNGLTCVGPECDRPARYVNPMALCSSHYLQLFFGRSGGVLSPLRRVRKVSDGQKQCSRCEEVLPVESYNRQSRGRVQSACKACQSVANRAARYRISFEEAQELMRGICATCGSDERLHVDHDHETGRVRGVLCHNCNTVLTKHMTPEVLRRLADYLER